MKKHLKKKRGFFILMGFAAVALSVMLWRGMAVSMEANVSAQTIQPGDGLSGRYYQFWNCTGTTRTRVDPKIDFSDDSKFGTGYHDPCVTWSGQIYVETGTGDYTFYVIHDDSVKLTVNNKLIYNRQDWTNIERATDVVTLESKKRYDITIEFYDLGGPGYLNLKWSGPGLSKQLIPQRVLYSTRTQCSDSVDNDNDGKTDYPADPGCAHAHDTEETDPPKPICSDTLDNDADGKTDFPSDLGCTSATDTDETDPPRANCDDDLDNDGDGKIDFPEDAGCSSSSDGDETDPPTPRPISLPGSGSQLVTTDGSKFPLGIQNGVPNELFVKVQVGTGFEMIRMTPTILPTTATVSNGSMHYYLLQGKDSTGKGHIVVTQGRSWDPGTFADATLTPEPWFSLFSTAKNLKACAAHIKTQFAANPMYLDNPLNFQQIIEALSLCQRGA